GAYSASKAAFATWTEALALEESVHGVHVGLVLPEFVPTEGASPRPSCASGRLLAGRFRRPRRWPTRSSRPGSAGAPSFTCPVRTGSRRPRGLWFQVVRRVTAGGAFMTTTRASE